MTIDTSSPFIRQVGLRHGVTDVHLAADGYRRLFQGIHVASETVITADVVGRAALLGSSAGAYLSHHTAGALWGGIVPTDPAVHVSTALSRSRRQGITSHRAMPDPVVRTVRGLRVSSPEQVLVELASAGVPLVDLVVYGDSVVHAGSTSPQRLADATKGYDGRGAAVARRAAGLVRRGVRSAMETRTRLLVVLAGLPEPEVAIELRGEDGVTCRELDMGYRSVRLAYEYDGAHHEGRREADLVRREELDHLGWRLLAFCSADIYRTPAQTLLRMTTAMDDVGLRRPRRLSSAWRRHFATDEVVRRPERR